MGRKLASLQSPKKSRLPQEDGGGEFGPPAKLYLRNKKPKKQTATGGSAW